MSVGGVLKIALAGAVLWMVVHYLRDPHRTMLPFGSTDLSSVQSQLTRLPADERKLVEDYVARSHGDVLPAKFADPDDPLTARTFGEAIALQRRWNGKMAVEAVRADKLREQRQAKLAPLRALVDASVVKAEILTRNEFQALRDPGFYQHTYQVDKTPAFAVRIRVRNLSNEPIVSIKGSLQAHDAQAYLPLDLCWIDFAKDLPPGGEQELLCGRTAGENEKAFVENPSPRFTVEWEPSYVKFADGRELASGL